MPRPEIQARFVEQQGFDRPPPASCGWRYQAILFQPRMIAAWLLLGLLTQSAAVFAALGAVLAFSALFPAANPFDALYHRWRGGKEGRARLGPAPPPRRFAQGVAAACCAAIVYFLRKGPVAAAWAVEAFLAAAVAALTLGAFCLGSFLFHLLRGRARLAWRTAPWSR